MNTRAERRVRVVRVAYDRRAPMPECLDCGRDLNERGECPVCDPAELKVRESEPDLLDEFPHVEDEASEEKYPA